MTWSADVKSRPNKYLSLLAWLMPNSGFKRWALRMLGNQIGADVTLGMNLVIGCGAFSIDDNAVIGNGNAFRNLAHVRMGTHARMGNWNYVTAAPEFQLHSDYVGMLIVESMGIITSRHYLDCGGLIILRRGAALGGVRSIFQSHELDVENCSSTAGPIVLEKNSLTGSGCIVLKGARVPERCVLAAGSVLPKARDDDESQMSGLYAGVPARHVRDLKDYAFWDRSVVIAQIDDFDDTAFRAALSELDS